MEKEIHNKKRYDVVALGELLIDFTENTMSDQGNPMLEANPGGAPCNVLAMLSELGKKTAFIGKVGADKFGRQLKAVVEDVGIATQGIVEDQSVHTTLAFVHTDQNGDREFSFYRNPGADMMLRKEEINEDMIKNGIIYHFGTLSFTHEFVKQASKEALEIARKSGAIISFDPNLREALWDNLEDARDAMEYGFQQCDVLKIADNELYYYTGEADCDKAAVLIKDTYDIKLVCVTLGKDGSKAYYEDLVVAAKGVEQKNTVDTTGAGDTFMGCVLNYILENGLSGLLKKDLQVMLQFANAAASLITSKRGALKVMPKRNEIYEMVKKGYKEQ